MCKTPKIKPVELRQPEVLYNPLTDGRRGLFSSYFANRLGRSSLVIRPGVNPVSTQPLPPPTRIYPGPGGPIINPGGGPGGTPGRDTELGRIELY